MKKQFTSQQTMTSNTNFTIRSDMEICQSDYPIDWYQQEFIPYAEEYQSLPDRQIKTILNWMTGYIEPAIKEFGDSLLLTAHYYMGGEIVKLIQHFGGKIGDSYQLALLAVNQPEKKLIVESAVHFMAETISILANSDQTTYITNPKSGCTMEMYAKDYMVEPAISELNERYGKQNILPICYMNTSGRLKAMTGEQGGAICTSSNVKKIFQWAQKKNKKILFIPDKNMGENVASWIGIPSEKIAYWPGGEESTQYSLFKQKDKVIKTFDESQLILFSSHCAVHSFFTPEMVRYWQEKGFNVVVHPESTKPTVNAANCCGSTAFIWEHVINDMAKTKKYAIGTENHMVQNLKQICQPKGIEVVHVADARISNEKGMGCGCATMSRNDPPHLVALLDLLRQGKAPEYNIVQPGDVVDEFTGTRQRLIKKDQQWIVENARLALEKMIMITEDRI